MFGLFRKKITVKEIEDGLHAAYLAFDLVSEPNQLNTLILDFKVKHFRTCPKSLALPSSVLHEDELYIFIWCFIFDHMASSGLRVNTDLFRPYSPLWKILDEYIQRAREKFKMKIWLDDYWQIEEASHTQKELSSECRDMIEGLIFRATEEQKTIESNVDWHDAKEFCRNYSSINENESITFSFDTDPVNWESSEDILVIFTRYAGNKTRIYARY